MPTRDSLSTLPKLTTVKAPERRSPKEDHFAALSRALLDVDVQDMPEQKRRSLLGRVAAYLIFAALILGIGIGAYAYATGQIELPSLTRLLERVLDWTQRLVERVLNWTRRLGSSG